MALTVTRVLNSDGSCNYTASMSAEGTTSVTVSKLVTGGTFELVETISVPFVDTGVYTGEFDGDGIYKFTTGSTNIIISNDCALTACLSSLCKKVICGGDACDVANYNSVILLAQVYWGLLDEDYQGTFIFNTSQLAANITTLSSIQKILDRISKYCSDTEDSDCNCK